MPISRVLLSMSFGVSSKGALPPCSLGERCPTPRGLLHSSFKVPFHVPWLKRINMGGKLTDITDCKTTQKVIENSVWDRKTSRVTTTAHSRCLVLALVLVILCYENYVLPCFGTGHWDKQIWTRSKKENLMSCTLFWWSMF